MFFSSLSFLAGVALVQQLPSLPGGPELLMGAILAAILARLRYRRCVFFLLGALWACVFAAGRLSERLPGTLEGIDLQIQGYIAGLPDANERGVRFDFAVKPGRADLPGKLRLSWNHPDAVLKAGQYWQLTVRLKRPHGFLNPGGFDYERWLLSEGIGATGYVRSFPKPELLPRKADWYRIDVWRQAISDRLSFMLAGSSGLGLIKALTIGDGSSISQNQWRLFSETGTTHLMVISGSHIGLIAGFVYLLALKLWASTAIFRWPPPKVAAVSAMLAAVLYSALAGFSVPVQRSVIMLTMLMVTIILQRNSRAIHTLSVALMAVLIVDPLALLSPGFWLSFLAVGLIVLAIAGRLTRPGYVTGAMKVQWYAAVGLFPVLTLYFQQVSLISPLANLIAVPVVGLLVVPLSLLAVGVMWATPAVAAVMLDWADLVLETLLRLLSAMTHLPSAVMTHPQPPLWTLLFAVPGILLLLAPAGTPSRWLGMVLLLPLSGADINRPEAGEIRLIMLDVGQGLAAAVQTEHHWLIYDTGPRFSESSDTGLLVLLPFLRSQHAARIDRLIVSHGDSDHIGGAVSLLKGINTGAVMTSVPELLDAYAPVRCVSGQAWQWDRVRFQILSPDQDSPGGDNNNSCVLKIESDHGSILLPGDIESGAELRLLQIYAGTLQADVLVAPHHGSKTSSTAAFLQAVRPRVVLIPSGYRNPFGHPHPDVLSRYRQSGAQWLDSAGSGAIEVNMKNHSLQIKALRQTEKRYWRHHSTVGQSR